MKLFSKLIRRIPPFRNLYRRIDALKKENTVLQKKLSAAQKESDQQYKVLEQQYKALKKQIDTNEKRCQELAEQEQKDCAALRERITAVNKTAAERDLQNYKKLSKQMGANRYELSREAEYYYYKGLEPSRYPDALKEWYYHNTGRELNLEHPRTYTEKIQWLKLYDSTPLKGELSDKYLVRDYVREKIGEEYLVPLLGVWDRAEDIPFDDLPERFALKVTHGSSWNIIVHDKSKLDVVNAKRKLNKWLKTDFAFYDGLEMHYRYTKPRIVAEAYMENTGGDIDDYKVFCFDGKARYILFLTGRQTALKKAVYDTDWNLMPFLDGGTRLEEDVPRPAHLTELVSLAEKLAEGFNHVRVDFYCLNTGEIKFGEMTFTPTSGQSLWEPEEYNLMLGDLIHLPCDECKAQ